MPLPTPDGDEGVWGYVLNAFLQVEHDPVTGQQLPGSITTAKLADGAVTDQKFSGQLSFGKLPTGSGANQVAVGDHTHDGRYVQSAQLGVAGGVAVLDANAKLPASVIPAIAITNVYVVANQAARLALSAQVGEVARQTDTGSVWILQSLPASTSGNWIQLNDTIGGGGSGTVVTVDGIGGTDIVLPADGPAGVATKRTLGTGANQAAAGNDPRLSDQRTPTAHTHAASDIVSGVLSIARIPTGTTSTTVALGSHTHTKAAITDLGVIGTAAALDVPASGFNATAAQVVRGDDTRVAGALQRSSNLSDLGSAVTARSNLGLGNAAVLNVGTTAGTVMAGDDPRITGALRATNNLSDLGSAATARGNLGLGAAATRAVGTTAGTVADGADSRIVGALQTANALSELTAQAATARANLGLGSAALATQGNSSDTQLPNVGQVNALIAAAIANSNPGGTPPTDPGSGNSPSMPAVPTGYTSYYAIDWNDANSWLKANGGMWIQRTGNQGGTESYSLAANTYVDTSLGALRLACKVQTQSSYLYTSGYMGTTPASTDAASYFPLFARFQFCARYPFAFTNWACGWLNYRGSASNFEIDFGEMFTFQSPCRVRMQCHSPNAYQSQYGVNLVNGNSMTNYLVPQRNPPISLTSPVTPGATRDNFDFDLGNTLDAGSIPGHTGWHVIECETYKVTKGTGWGLGVDFYIDGVKVCTWTEPNATNTTPSWYQAGHDNVAGDDAYSWDMRFDHWVGGSGFPRATKNGTTNFVYDNTKVDGTSAGGRPIAEVPNPTLWQASTSNIYYYDIAWFRVLKNTGAGSGTGTGGGTGGSGTGGGTNTLFVSNTTGKTGTVADPPTGTNFSHRYPTTNTTGTVAMTYNTTTTVPVSAQPSIQHVVGDGVGGGTASRYCQIYWEGGSATVYPSLWLRTYLRIPAASGNPGATLVVCEAGDYGGGLGTFAAWRLNTSRKLELRSIVSNGTTPSTVATTTTTLSYDTWYCLELAVSTDTHTTIGRLSDATGALIEQLSGTYVPSSDTTYAPQRASFGINGSANLSYTVLTGGHGASQDNWLNPL